MTKITGKANMKTIQYGFFSFYDREAGTLQRVNFVSAILSILWGRCTSGNINVLSFSMNDQLRFIAES